MPIFEAGTDEAGRGPLAGPVFAAAVILPQHYELPELTDSKKLTSAQRDKLFDAIIKVAVSYHIAEASVEEIDTLNILRASLLAMRRAVLALDPVPHKVWVDGVHVPDVPMLSEAVVSGDSLIPSISAASILAKVARDRYLLLLDEQYPQYGFAKHKGYPTAVHLKALAQYGVSPVHRKSFGPVKSRLALEMLA